MVFFFFFNDTATTEIYTLSLHDALPISLVPVVERSRLTGQGRSLSRRSCRARVRITFSSSIDVCDSTAASDHEPASSRRDRKSTRLNSSHQIISYAVFCLKKKKNTTTTF